MTTNSSADKVVADLADLEAVLAVSRSDAHGVEIVRAAVARIAMLERELAEARKAHELANIRGFEAGRSPEPREFQDRVRPWLIQCFGEEVASNKIERNHRFIEEALELVQALGCTKEHAHQIADYVYGRPAGDPFQEIGGVMVTLAALCLASGLRMNNAAERELTRVWDKIDVIRAKQARKVKDSALPGSSSPEASDCQHDLLKSDTTMEVIDKWKAKCKVCIEFFDLPGRPEFHFRPHETKEKRCQSCDGTGDVHRPDGEWLGFCSCPAGESLKKREQ